MDNIFLFREKAADRDCCAYIDHQPRFECDHYFGKINLFGNCYSGRNVPDYDSVETVLTLSEWNRLWKYDAFLSNIGYGIKKGDERFLNVISEFKKVKYIFDKLMYSDEAKGFHNNIIKSEIDCLKEVYSFDEDDIKEILEYRHFNMLDRSIISAVHYDKYKYGEELVYRWAPSLPPFINKYVDFKRLASNCMSDAVELSDGRIVEFSV